MNYFLKLRRFVSAAVAVSFLVTNIIIPSPMAHAQSALKVNPGSLGGELSGKFRSFSIPPELGKVSEIVAMPQSPSLLIHIQEAHANYDAQKNIREILGHLNKNYGVRLILLEGAGNKIDPELYYFFPEEPGLQKAVTEKLLQVGELTGAEAFLIQKQDGGERMTDGKKPSALSSILYPSSAFVEGYGVEDAALYAQDREAFRQVYAGRRLTQDFLGTFFRQWQKSAASALNKPLKEFLARETAFEENQITLADWMLSLKGAAANHFRIDLENVGEQKDWPVLVRYFRLRALDSKIDKAKVELEKKKFLAEIVKYGVQRGEKNLGDEINAIFESASKHDLPAYKTRFVFEKLLDQLPKDFSFESYPHLRLYIQQMILLSELQSDMLQDEIKRLTEKITIGLTKTEQDRRLVGALQDYRLVRKLFQLELGREEYQILISKKITIEKLLQNFQEVGERIKDEGKLKTSVILHPSSFIQRIVALYGTAIRFYEGAIERENKMMERAFARMKEQKQTKAVLITGGFHTEGLKEKALAAGSSYIEVTPRINGITPDERKHYLQALLGDLSWDSGLKTRDAEKLFAGAEKQASSPVTQANIGAPIRSEVRFLQLISRDTWRRELSLRGARLLGLLQGVPGVDAAKAKTAVRDYIRKALDTLKSFPKELQNNMSGNVFLQTEPVPVTVSRSEVRGDQRILFAEDDEATAVLAMRALKKNGYQDVVYARDGKEALEILKNSGPFALLVTDLNMPGMDGDHLVEEARAQGFPKGTPVLFHSDDPRTDDIAIELGVEVVPNSKNGYIEEWTDSLVKSVQGKIGPARSEIRGAAQDVASKSPALPGLTLQLPFDVGTEIWGGRVKSSEQALILSDALSKATELLESLRENLGVGRVFPYNSLFAPSEISHRIHQVPDTKDHFLISRDGKTTVMVSGYETKHKNIAGLALRDDKGNAYSVSSMLKLNPELSDSGFGDGTSEKTEEGIKAFNEKAHSLGMRTVADFIPEIAPDAIDENNLDWVFHKKMSPSENEYFRSLPESGKKGFIKNLLKNNGGAFFARRVGEGSAEEVVLIRHFPGIGGHNADQTLLNIFSTSVQDYYKKSLRYLIDLGFDAVRVDMGSFLLREKLLAFVREASLNLEIPAAGEPLQAILQDAQNYAAAQGRKLEFIFETYDREDQKALVRAGLSSPVAVYEDSFFRGLFEFACNPTISASEIASTLVEVLLYGVRHPGDLSRFLLYPTNHDQTPLAAMADYRKDAGRNFSVSGVLGLTLVTAYLATDSLNMMLTLRDALGHGGDIRPIVGGDIKGHRADLSGKHAHPFVNTTNEFYVRTNFQRLLRTIREAPASKFLQALVSVTQGAKQNYIWDLDNANRERFISLGWGTEDGRRVIFLVDLRPNQPSQDLRFIEFPVRAGEKASPENWEVKDGLTGEILSAVTEVHDKEYPRIQNISFPKGTDYRFIVLTPKEGTASRSEMRDLPQRIGSFPSTLDDKNRMKVPVGIRRLLEGRTEFTAVADKDEQNRPILRVFYEGEDWDAWVQENRPEGFREARIFEDRIRRRSFPLKMDSNFRIIISNAFQNGYLPKTAGPTDYTFAWSSDSFLIYPSSYDKPAESSRSEVRGWTRFKEVRIPKEFAPPLVPYLLKGYKVEVSNLDGEFVPADLLTNERDGKFLSFALSSSIGQALGAVPFVGLGEPSQKVAHENAVHFTERSIEYFTKKNPKIAIVILADVGAREETSSLPVGTIYKNGIKISRDSNEKLFNDLGRLRKEEYQILYFVGTALEKPNAFYSLEALKNPTDSASVSSFFIETPDSRLDEGGRDLVSDDFRFGGTSYNAPQDAKVSPFDLPSVVLPKIAKARKERPDLFINRAVVLTLARRPRHEAIIKDVEALKKSYPHLTLLTPNDGDVLARMVAMLGVDLDGKHMVVFGRSGPAEATIARMTAANREGARFSHTFVSPSATDREYSFKRAHQYKGSERKAFKELGIPPSIYDNFFQKEDIRGTGIVALTSVTGASPRFYGEKLSKFLQRVSWSNFEEKRGEIVTNTLLVTPAGSAFIVRTTLVSPNIEIAFRKLKWASHPAREYWRNQGEEDPVEIKENKKNGFPKNALINILNATMPGLELLDTVLKSSFQSRSGQLLNLHEAAGVAFGQGLLTEEMMQEHVRLAEQLLAAFHQQVNSALKESERRFLKISQIKAKADVFFDTSFFGDSKIKVSEFLSQSHITIEDIKDKEIRFIVKGLGYSLPLVIQGFSSMEALDLAFEKRRVRDVSSLEALWIQDVSRSENRMIISGAVSGVNGVGVQSADVLLKRSEVRLSHGFVAGPAGKSAVFFEKLGRRLVAIQEGKIGTKVYELQEKKGIEAYTVVSRQLEAGLDRAILEKLHSKLAHRFPNEGDMIRRYVGTVAETTLTGGLGALMHDLFPAWAQVLGSQNQGPQDLLAINVIYDRIKGQQYAKYLPDEVRQGKVTLGDYLRSVLKIDRTLRLSFELEVGEVFRRKATEEKTWAEQSGAPEYKEMTRKTQGIISKKILVDIYPTETHFNQVPNYYIDAYYYDEKGEKVRVFDEVYPDAPHGHPNLWRDVHMAIYGLATQNLVKKLQEKGVIKNEILFVDNEVFVSTPTPMFPDAIHHHINHTVFRPGLYMPDEASYEMLGYPETLRKFILKDGKIDVVNAVGISSRFPLITGVALYEHSNVLADDILAPFINRLETFNENGVRNTNGVLLEQWQSPLLRRLINQYKQQVGLKVEDPDIKFFEALSSPKHAAALETFKQKVGFAKAVGILETLLWLKEDQKFPGWFDEVVTAYREKAGEQTIDSQKLVEDFRKAVDLALGEPEAWQDLLQRGDYDFLKEFLFKNPMLTNVRRQVSYKGPDKWIEILEDLKKNPQALAEFKTKAPRIIIGGREFGEEAHGMFLKIQNLVAAMGLQDRIATIEDYNIYIAPIIFQGISGAIMLSDEFLEASATSMMKIMANLGALIGVWGGADPELFTIVETVTGRELDVFKEKITHDQLVEKLKAGEWKITNGFLISYSNDEKSHLEGGGRRPSAASLLKGLYDLSARYQDPVERRDLQFAVLRSTPKVDMAKGQAVAHKALWEKTIQTLQEEDELFDGLKIPADEARKFLERSLAQGAPWEFYWHGTSQDARSILGILGFVEGFRYLRMKGRESYNSIAYHAVRGEKGDIFVYLDKFFEGFDATLTPVINKIRELEVRAQAAQTVQEKVQANLEALEIAERLVVEVSYDFFEHYVRTQDKEAEAFLANPVVRENIATYLDQHAVSFKSIAKKIRGYSVNIDGQKYLVALNLGEYGFPGATGDKAWSYLYGREALEDLTGSREGSRVYKVVDLISGKSYGTYPLWKMAETIPAGVPTVIEVQVLRLEDTGERTEEQEVLLGKDVMDYLEALTSGRVVSGGQPVTRLLFQKIRAGVGSPEKMGKLLKNVTTLSRNDAINKFGHQGIPAVMAFVATLSPDRLKRIKSWNPEVFAALSKVIHHPRLENLFKDGDIWFHHVDRDSAMVISRSLPGESTNAVVPIHFPLNPFRVDDGKAWFRVLDVNHLGIQASDGMSYRIFNHLTGEAYPLEHSSEKLLSEKWSIGVPVEVPQSSGVRREPTYRFQVLEVLPTTSPLIQRSEARQPRDQRVMKATDRQEFDMLRSKALISSVVGFGAEISLSRMRSEVRTQRDEFGIDGIGNEGVDGENIAAALKNAGHSVGFISEDMEVLRMVEEISKYQVIYLAPTLDENYDYGAYEKRLMDMAIKKIGPAMRSVRDFKDSQRKIFIFRGMVDPGTSKRLYEAIKWNAHPAGDDDLNFDFVFQPDFAYKDPKTKKDVEPIIVFGLMTDKTEEFQNKTKAILNKIYGSYFKGVEIQYVNIKSAEMEKEMQLLLLGAKLAHFDDAALLSRAFGADLSAAAYGAGLDKRIRTLFTNPSLGFGGRLFVYLHWIYAQRLHKFVAESERSVSQSREDYKKEIEQRVDSAIQRLENAKDDPNLDEIAQETLVKLTPQLHFLFVLKYILSVNKRNILDFYKTIERDYKKIGDLRGKKAAFLSLGNRTKGGEMTASPTFLLIDRLFVDYGVSEFYVADPGAEDAFKRWIEKKKAENPRFGAIRVIFSKDVYEAARQADLTIIPADSNPDLAGMNIDQLAAALEGKPLFDGMNLFGLRADGSSSYKLEEIRQKGINYVSVGRLPLGPVFDDSNNGYTLSDSIVAGKREQTADEKIQDYERVYQEIAGTPITASQKKVAVVGFSGYVGLVTGALFGVMGHRVYGVDLPHRQKDMEALNGPDTVVPIYEKGLREMFIEGKENGLVTSSTDLEEAVKESSIIYLAVGTPSQDSGEVDLTAILKATGNIGDIIKKHGGPMRILAVKSTVTPNTFIEMDKVLREKGLVLGKDYALVSNPEFLRQGEAVEDVTEPDRTVLGFYAGMTLEARRRVMKEMMELWHPLMRKHPHTMLLTDTASSTIIKYLANSFLAISITDANLFSDIAEWDGADYMEVRKALLADPRIGPNASLASGPGWGGSCFPKDVDAVDYNSYKYTGHRLPIVKLSTWLNRYYKKAIVEKMVQGIIDFPDAKKPMEGKTVNMLGLTFKANTDDTREAPSVYILRELLARGVAQVRIHDLMFTLEGAPPKESVIDHFLDYLFKEFLHDREFEKAYHDFLDSKNPSYKKLVIDFQDVTGKISSEEEKERAMRQLFFKKIYFPNVYLSTKRVIFESDLEAMGPADVTFLVTEWPQYKDLDLQKFKPHGKKYAVVDGRNLFYNSRFAIKKFADYFGVGTTTAPPLSVAAKTRSNGSNGNDSRSEVRSVVSVTTAEQLIGENTRRGGGSLVGFKRVTEELTDGIWSLVAHTFDATRLVAGLFEKTISAQKNDISAIAVGPQTRLERLAFSAARSSLGIKSLAPSDGFILGKDLAFSDGALIVMRKIFGDAPVAILASERSLSEAERKLYEEINRQLVSAGRSKILMVSSVEEARRVLVPKAQGRHALTASLQLKAMANVSEASAEMLKQQLGDNAILVTSKRFRTFLDLAGVTAFVESMQAAYLATARAA